MIDNVERHRRGGEHGVQQPAIGMQPAERPVISAGLGWIAACFDQRLDSSVQLSQRSVEESLALGPWQQRGLTESGYPRLQAGYVVM